MATMKPADTVTLEATTAELALIRKALRIMQSYAGYEDQRECDLLSQLMLDLREGA